MRVLRALVLVGGILGAASPARAQCGAALSECRSCHEARGEKPVLAGPSPWHRDHGFGDFCPLCHGGNAQAKDAASAHVGVTSPLAVPTATCGSCHGAESTALAQRYAQAAAALPPPPPSPPSATPPAGRTVAWGDVALTSVILLVGAAGAAFVARTERLRAEAPAKGASS
jgi:cytochrome c553